MRHFAPLPTSEARFCSSLAACGLRRALRAASIRLCASRLFMARTDIVFTKRKFIQHSDGRGKFVAGLSERARAQVVTIFGVRYGVNQAIDDPSCGSRDILVSSVRLY